MPSLHAVRAELAFRSYHEFVKQAFEYTGAGRELVDNWHIKYLCDLVQDVVERLVAGKQVEDIIVNVPPGSLKSTIFGKCLFPWAILRNPGFSHLGTSYSDDLAMRDSRQARDVIESPWYQQSFCNPEFQRRHGFIPGLKKDQNQKGQFETQHGGERYAAGIMGTITGKHFHLITADDPNNPKEAESEAAREKVVRVLDEILPTRFKSKESRCIIVIQQRINDKDATGYSLSKDPERKRWRHICIPAEIGDNVSPPELKDHYRDGLFFPSEFTRDFLDRQKDGMFMGPTKYAAQYLMQTAPAEGNMIKSHYFRWYTPDELPKGTANFDVDTAYGEDDQKSKAKGHSAFSVILAHVTHEQRLYLTALSRNRYDSPKWRRHLVEWVMAHGYTSESRIRIEPKANGVSQIQELRNGLEYGGQMHRLNIVPDQTKDGGKEVMVENALPKLETGAVLLPGSDHPLPGHGWTTALNVPQPDGSNALKYVPEWVPAFLQECITFPKSEYADQVDCLTQAIRNQLRVSLWDIVR